MVKTEKDLRQLIFGISLPHSDQIWKKLLAGEDGGKRRFRQVFNTFVLGYVKALEVGYCELLIRKLETLDWELKEYAYEGAGMAITILDCLSPEQPSRQLQDFVAGTVAKNSKIAHVGAGIAIAMLNQNLDTAIAKMEPMNRWYAADGFGFAHGLYCWQHTIKNQATPEALTGYTKRAVDWGIGRSIWFGSGADPKEAINIVRTFSSERQADLWCGLGFASSHAGGTTVVGYEALKAAAGFNLPNLMTGSATASWWRYTENQAPEHTALACSVICDLPIAAVCELANAILSDLPQIEQESTQVEKPLFEQWRQRLMSYWASRVAV